MTSATCAGPIISAPAECAIVPASLSTRWKPRGKGCGTCGGFQGSPTLKDAVPALCKSLVFSGVPGAWYAS